MIRIPLLVAAVLVLAGGPTSACPFCSTIPGFTTVQRVLGDNPQVVIARPKPDGDGGVAHLVVVDVLRGGAEKGRRITVDEPLVFGEARAYVVLAKTVDFAKSKARPLDKENEAFMRGVAALPPRKSTDPAERFQRLSFFLDHLGRPNRLVAASVSEEFANAEYGSVKALRKRLKLERLVPTVEDPEGFALHRGITYLLVGLVGNNEAGRHLARWMADPDRRARPGFDGLMGAWLLVRGEPGLASIRALRPPRDAPRQARRWYGRSLANALDFHAVYESRLPRRVLLDEAVAQLDDTEAAAPLVELLEKLSAWDRRAAVEAALRDAPEGHREFRRTARRFLARCPPQDSAPKSGTKR